MSALFGSQAFWNVGNAGMSQFDPASLQFTQNAPSSPGISTAPSGSVAAPNMGNLGAGGGAADLTKLTGMDKGKLALGGLQSLGNLYLGFQAMNMARKQFNFQRDFANANLAQSIKQYNTSLEDRIRSRAATEGRDEAWANSYLERNRLNDSRVGG